MNYRRLREGLPIPGDAIVQDIDEPRLARSVAGFAVGLEYRAIPRVVLVPEDSAAGDKEFYLIEVEPGTTPVHPMIIKGRATG